MFQNLTYVKHLLIMGDFGIFNRILTVLPYKSNPKNSVNVTENIVFIVKSNYVIRVSSAEVAVKVFRQLESEDFRILNIIESAMSKREFVPIEQIQKYAKLPMDRIEFTLGKLSKLGLIFRTGSLCWVHLKLCRLRLPGDKYPC